jgi:hypothetical protein
MSVVSKYGLLWIFEGGLMYDFKLQIEVTILYIFLA